MLVSKFRRQKVELVWSLHTHVRSQQESILNKQRSLAMSSWLFTHRGTKTCENTGRHSGTLCSRTDDLPQFNIRTFTSTSYSGQDFRSMFRSDCMRKVPSTGIEFSITVTCDKHVVFVPSQIFN